MKKIRENKRLFLGIFIVLLIFISVFVVDKISKIDNFNQIINASSKYQSDLPLNFSREIFNIDGLSANDIKTAQDNKIIGFSIADNADKVFNQIKSKLEENNWIYVDSGKNTTASFYKSNGQYQWLFLDCTNFNDTTSVVITIN